MPPRPTHDPAYLDPNHQRISEFAAWMWDGEDDDEAREGFITDAMTQKGYTPRTRTDWDPPADPGKGGSNGGQGGGQQRQRPPYFKR